MRANLQTTAAIGDPQTLHSVRGTSLPEQLCLRFGQWTTPESGIVTSAVHWLCTCHVVLAFDANPVPFYRLAAERRDWRDTRFIWVLSDILGASNRGIRTVWRFREAVDPEEAVLSRKRARRSNPGG